MRTAGQTDPMETVERNWAGNHAYRARIERPRSVAELQEVVAREPRVRALGSRHSFTDVTDKAGVAGVYNRATYAAEKRQAMQLWGEHVAGIVGLADPKIAALDAARKRERA